MSKKPISPANLHGVGSSDLLCSPSRTERECWQKIRDGYIVIPTSSYFEAVKREKTYARKKAEQEQIKGESKIQRRLRAENLATLHGRKVDAPVDGNAPKIQNHE